MNNSTIDIRKKADKRELILSVAQKRFAQYGFHKTTIDEIASDVRISKGLIYHYFPSKEDIFYLVLERESVIIVEEIQQAVGNAGTTQEKLAAFHRTILVRLSGTFNLKELIENPGELVLPELMKRFKEFKKQTVEIAKSIIEEGIKSGEFKKMDSYKTALIFTGLVKPIEILVHEYEFELDEIINLTLNIFLEDINSKR